MPFEPGKRFALSKKLGSGSFGIVYEAVDHLRHRSVALKVLERAAPETVTRFKREFRYLAELRHPNLASMYELLVLDERWVLSMELVRGMELLEYLAFTELQNSFLASTGSMTFKVGTPSPFAMVSKPGNRTSVSVQYAENVRETFRQLAVAIAVLHSRDIVHRDIKPSNIMITAEGRVVLLDFGLIVEVELDETIDRRKVVGTPGYMSPEQMTAAMPTTASDWYAFGVLLYQALTGQLPFLGQTALEVMERMMRDEIVPANDIVEGVPLDLAELAGDVLRREPHQRAGDIEILQRLGVTGFDPLRGTRMRDRDVVLFGRADEVRTLFSHVTTMEKGTPLVVQVHGSPGVGKTALVDTILNRVRAETDSLILGGRCHAWESLPMNAVDAIVDSLARAIRRERPAAVDEVMKRVVAATRLFPALVFEGQSAALDETIAVPTGPKLLARAATELGSIIAAAAGERPIVIMLDDAQWGDYQSAVMFQKILSGLAENRVVLMLVYRTEDWQTSLLLQTLLNIDLSRVEVEVPDLSPEALAQLARTKDPKVHAESGGNPTLAQMVLVTREQTLGDAIRERLERLSAPARRIFGSMLSATAAVDENVLEQQLELIDADEPLRTLSRERLIRVRRTGDLHEIDIYHPRMRRV